MKIPASFFWALSAGLLITLCIAIIALHRNSTTGAVAEAEDSITRQAKLAEMDRTIRSLRDEVKQLREGRDGNATPVSPDLADRLATVESSVEQLQDGLEFVNLEKASQEREELFRSEFGFEKADEFLELGSFAIAGNGYLQFLESYPDHPDARDIMQKAREAYLKAGYQDKAGWVQEQIMERYPDSIAKDAYKMALMLKKQGRYDEAMEYVNAAAQASSNDVERLWRLQYGAYLVEQRDGNAAGAAAYRNVLKQIEAANLSEDRLGTTTRERIADLESRTSQGGS